MDCCSDKTSKLNAMISQYIIDQTINQLTEKNNQKITCTLHAYTHRIACAFVSLSLCSAEMGVMFMLNESRNTLSCKIPNLHNVAQVYSQWQHSIFYHCSQKQDSWMMLLCQKVQTLKLNWLVMSPNVEEFITPELAFQEVRWFTANQSDWRSELPPSTTPHTSYTHIHTHMHTQYLTT